MSDDEVPKRFKTQIIEILPRTKRTMLLLEQKQQQERLQLQRQENVK